jgi:RNA polymerase sigma factor (sigma-70 family)
MADRNIEVVGTRVGDLIGSEGKTHRSSLDELIVVYADPIIKKILLYRLNFYLGSRGTGINQPEAEDLYQTVLLKLVSCFRSDGADAMAQDVCRINSYVATVTHNVCNDFLRMKYPERNRLKNKLRDLMRRHPDFTCWIVENQTLCGLRGWTGRPESQKAARLLSGLNGDEEDGTTGKPDLRDLVDIPLTGLITELFNRCEGPIEIDRLVHTVAKVQGIEDRLNASPAARDVSELQIADPKEGSYTHLELRELLHRLWTAASKLPLKQKRAFVFTSHDYSGESLLHRILREQIVTITQIYNSLEMTRDELVSIWGRLPMDALATAAELGTSTQMVAKWRHRALRKLSIEIGICK